MKKRARNKFWLTAYLFIVALRVLTPFLIFFQPLTAIILVTFLDIVDVEFASRRAVSLDEYECFDKILDFWWYSIAMIYAWTYIPEFAVFLLGLYLFRLLGFTIFILTGKRRVLFLFPGFFENVFFVIFFGLKIDKLQFLLAGNNLYVFLFFAFAAKMIQEWWVHWAQISIPEKFFNKKRNWIK